MSCSECLDSTTTFCGHCGELVPRGLIDVVLDGRYRIDAKIASGGFGTVYRATALETGLAVAIKVLHEQHEADPSASARFRREAVAMSNLRDAHTVTTYELGEDPDGTRFIVMELLEGESLLDRFIARGALPWRSVMTIVRAVCSSLAEAHALGIVHRDLKPANIYLASQPVMDHVKVLDFGIAKIVHGSDIHDGSEITRIGQAIGTLEYMSPEQIVGGEIDQRTDLYTLGVVMYEMITGRRPFSDVTAATGLVTALMTRRPPPPSTVAPTCLRAQPLPPTLDSVVLRCLERDAEDRYADVHELAAAIDRMLQARFDASTTQQLWLNTPMPAAHVSESILAHGDDATWIDRTPTDVHPVRFDEPFGEPIGLSRPVLDDVMRAQLSMNPRPGSESATPRPQLAVGSSRVITTRSSAAVPRTSTARIAIWAFGLALLGLGLGATVATITF